jgi:hypothetical protein
MVATGLTYDPQGHFRSSRKLRGLFILVLFAVALLLVERWRGQAALSAWQRDYTAKGETLDPAQLWPKPDEASRQFSNQLARVIRQLPPELTALGGRFSGMVSEEPDRARRGSQESRPPLNHNGDNTNTWPQIEAAASKGAAAVEDLRRLMRDAPVAMGDDIRERMENDGIPNFVSVRVGAQTLHTAVLVDLHRNNLDGALENLTALSASIRLYADEPTLVNFMIRVAILGLSQGAYWDALQAPGWTDSQLARLQQAAQVHPRLTQLLRALQAERAVRLHTLESFRAQSYEAWLKQHEPLYQCFGMKLPAWRTSTPYRQWQQWVFHPLWGFAWADQEKLHYLKHTQRELEALRDAVQRETWSSLNERLKAIESDYRPPVARWRFCGSLPLYDDLSAVIGSSRPPEPVCPYPDFTRAWQVTFKNLARHQLVITAIALKRHELQHGRLPATLQALAPDFLPTVPCDLMDGQPLRYRPNPDGSLVLYSVGDDLRDDGGDALPDLAQGSHRNAPREGRDWVWPRLVAGDPQLGFRPNQGSK